MRQHVLDFLAEAANVLNPPEPIVEIGCRPAEGQEDLTDPRSFFSCREYIGCDIQPGPRVDRIEDVHHLTFESGSIGTVLALDTLEHVRDPIRAIEEVQRVLRPGGVFIMTSVMFFPIHEHPWDYWRFTPECFRMLLSPFETNLTFAHGWEFMPDTVYGIGINSASRRLDLDMFPSTASWLGRWGEDSPVDLGPIRLTTRDLWSITIRTSVGAIRRRLDRRHR